MRHLRWIAGRIAGIRKLRVPPRELPVAKPSSELDLIARVLRNLDAEVDSIGSSRRNQSHVYDSAGRPGITLVDRVPVLVDLQRAIEMSALLNRPFAAIVDL